MLIQQQRCAGKANKAGEEKENDINIKIRAEMKGKRVKTPSYFLVLIPKSGSIHSNLPWGFVIHR